MRLGLCVILSFVVFVFYCAWEMLGRPMATFLNLQDSAEMSAMCLSSSHFMYGMNMCDMFAGKICTPES